MFLKIGGSGRIQSNRTHWNVLQGENILCALNHTAAISHTWLSSIGNVASVTEDLHFILHVIVLILKMYTYFYCDKIHSV